MCTRVPCLLRCPSESCSFLKWQATLCSSFMNFDRSLPGWRIVVNDLVLLLFVSFICTSLLQISWIQRSSLGPRSFRHCFRGVREWRTVRDSQRCSSGIPDYPITCHENHLCEEVISQLFHLSCSSWNNRFYLYNNVNFFPRRFLPKQLLTCITVPLYPFRTRFRNTLITVKVHCALSSSFQMIVSYKSAGCFRFIVSENKRF